MSMEETREYRCALIANVLWRAGSDGLTAAEVAEHAAGLAMGEGHERAAWAPLSPATVLGHLRAMQNAGAVANGAPKRNGRNGRDEPSWCLADRPSRAPMLLPPPCEDAAPMPAPAVATTPYDHMSREQLIAVLSIHDRIAGAIANCKHELDAIAGDARQQLMGLGLEFPR